MSMMAHQQAVQDYSVAGNSAGASLSFQPGMCLRDIERLVILETLKHQGFNRTRAARVLGIGIRTLQRKLKEYRAAGMLVGAI